MSGRNTARHVDADPGWVQRRFRELQAEISALRVGKISAVPGSSVTIQQILTDPASVLGFVNTDQVTASTNDATVFLPLSYIPIAGSLHVRQNGLDLLASEWTLAGAVVTIAPGSELIVRAGDVFDAAYAYDPITGIIPPPSPSVVGFETPGTWDSGAATLSYAAPAGTAAGDLLILTVRGSVAPGGGETVDGLTCTDPRMSLAYAATSLNGAHLVMESIWVGTADGSGSPIVVSVPAGTVDPGKGILTSITGANGWGAISAIETGTTTPVVTGVAAAAVTWIRGDSFLTVTASAPSGYTDVRNTGAAYSSTDVSLWSDVTATASPAGTFTGEGCCVIEIT